MPHGTGAGTADSDHRHADGAGVAAPAVHRDRRDFRLAVAKSLLSGSRAALPP
jgi:hypothetical protein